MLTARIVPSAQYHDTLYVRSRVRQLEDLTKRFVELLDDADGGGGGGGDEGGFEVPHGLVSQGTTLVTELIVFATDSDNADPFTRGAAHPRAAAPAHRAQHFDVAIHASTLAAKASERAAAAAAKERELEERVRRRWRRPAPELERQRAQPRQQHHHGAGKAQ